MQDAGSSAHRGRVQTTTPTTNWCILPRTTRHPPADGSPRTNRGPAPRDGGARCSAAQGAQRRDGVAKASGTGYCLVPKPLCSQCLGTYPLKWVTIFYRLVDNARGVDKWVCVQATEPSVQSGRTKCAALAPRQHQQLTASATKIVVHFASHLSPSGDDA